MTDTASIESFIWGIADYARDAIERKDYNKIVLSFSLLRRLEQFIAATVFFYPQEPRLLLMNSMYFFISAISSSVRSSTLI